MADRRSEVVLSIGSQVANIDLVKAVLDETLSNLGLDEEQEQWLELAVREAVANAIIHGNGEDRDKRVTMTVRCDDDELVVEIGDEGEGFDPEKLPDPRQPENLLRPNGRGIFYMKKCMDSIDYDFRPTGTVVTMRKQLSHHTEEAEPQEAHE